MDSLARKISIIFLGSVFSSALAGCGGGGSNAMLPATSSAGAGSLVSPNNIAVQDTATSSVQFTITVPTAAVKTQSGSRSLEYISASTKSAKISIAAAGAAAQNTSVTCTKTCSATLQVPVGVTTFAVGLYDGADGSGNVLATGTATTTIVKAQANKVSIVFNGVPVNLAVAISPTSWISGKSTTSAVAVTAYDADGNIIIGAQNYANPITLSNSDTSGATTLSTTSVVSPSTAVTLRYNGASGLTQDIVTANDGAHSATAQVAVSIPATPTPAPTVAPTQAPVVSGAPQTIAMKHILTYQEHLGWTQVTPFGTNYGAIAPYVDYALTDAPAAPAMRAAGVKIGFYATVHTICYAQSYGECTPDASQVPSSDIAKTCNGDEVTFSSPASGSNPNPLVQLQTDPANPALATLMNNVIDVRTANGGSPVQYDFVFDDNANVPGDSLGWQQWYDLATGAVTSPAPYCNYSNAEYISGMRSLFTNLKLPAIANSLNIPDSAPAASTAVQYFSGSANLWGGMFEYIYGSSVNGSSRLKESDRMWQSEENTQLATSNAHRLFVGYEHVGGTDAAGLDERLYVYASLLLAYDPASLVMAEDGTDSNSHVNVNPEAQIVPTQPLVAQPTNIVSLQRLGGAYAREFAACYYQGTLIGPCASVVNSSSVLPAPMPTLSRSYSHTAVFSGAGIVPGKDDGKVTFNGSAPPATLAAKTAVILFP